MRTAALVLSLATAALCLATPAAQADCLQDARATVSGMTKLPPFRIAIKTTSNGIESRMTGDVIMPNSFRLVFGNSAMVITPRGAWLKDKSGWKPQPEDNATLIRQTLLSGLTSSLDKMSNVKCSAKSKINGKAYRTIEFDTYAKSPQTPLARMTYYLNAKNLPVWIITRGYSTKGNSAVVQQFTYDSKIRIDDPQ